MRDDDSKIADAELIMRFFAGDGTTSYRFPKPDSPEELSARGALARVVRDYVPGFSGELLALALDPDTPSRFVGMTPTRKVRFESLRRGRPSAWRRNLRIADFMRRKFSETDQHESVFADAMSEFGISRTTAQSIWDWHCKAMAEAANKHAGN